jgi:hypothetical protein
MASVSIRDDQLKNEAECSRAMDGTWVKNTADIAASTAREDDDHHYPQAIIGK